MHAACVHTGITAMACLIGTHHCSQQVVWNAWLSTLGHAPQIDAGDMLSKFGGESVAQHVAAAVAPVVHHASEAVSPFVAHAAQVLALCLCVNPHTWLSCTHLCMLVVKLYLC